jgi:hypothetical protein
MTISNLNSAKADNQEEITENNDESYISTNNIRLNHKWRYDLDTDETFLRDLPKVRQMRK